MSEKGGLPAKTEFLLYTAEDGKIKIQTRMQNETVWLTQDQMARLFDKAKSTINEHIRNIFEEGELKPDAVMRKFGISEFSTKPTNYYNLDVVISVGYRVKSPRGTQFRAWATERLKNYILKGFAIDSDRFKKGSRFDARFYDELLEEIREIRASERLAYQKITDVYATAVDYSPNTAGAERFFAAVQ